jgi:MFS family permease
LKGIPFADIKRALKGNIFYLGLVSFFTDLSSEMIYPLIPMFFTGLVPPASAAIYIGLMDGIAESTSSLLKIYAGNLSDKFGSRKPLALAGYAISSLARPLMAIAMAGWHVVALRFVDRIGKGIRTSPRDALISESVDCDVRGLAFSFHRMMDHTGAVGGPLLASLFLYFTLGSSTLWQKGNGSATVEEMHALRILFAIALIPGLAATITLWRWVKDTPRKSDQIDPCEPNLPNESKLPSVSKLPSGFYVFLGSVVLFTLGNSSDLFLIFFAQTRFGLGLGWIIALWILLHVSKIIFSLPGGRFSDKKGRRITIIYGWLIYVAVYCAIPFSSSIWMICALLFIYGAYYGMTEGAERALVADLVESNMRGRAYGLFHGAVGLAALPASLLFGLFWAQLGPMKAFLIGASLAASAVIVLSIYLHMGRRIWRQKTSL